MMMTRQDFNLLEKVIRSHVVANNRRTQRPYQNAIDYELGSLARKMANELEREYSNFNKAKFLRGCGL